MYYKIRDKVAVQKRILSGICFLDSARLEEVVFIKSEKREWAISLLKEKFSELGRIPKKDDFDDVTRSRIKAYLGPWPRALEESGIKEKRK